MRHNSTDEMMIPNNIMRLLLVCTSSKFSYIVACVGNDIEPLAYTFLC